MAAGIGGHRRPAAARRGGRALKKGRRLPLVLGALAALVTLLVVGPVAIAVALLRSSSDARGPDPAAQLFIGVLALALAALAGAAVWALTRLALRLLRRGG